MSFFAFCLAWTCFWFPHCNFGIPQSWLIWVWLPPELSASIFISYNLSFSKCLEKHLPVLYPCTVCCSRFPGFCLLQRHIKKDNNNKIYQKELFSRDVEYKQFIRTLLKLPGVDQSPKSIVFSQFWYGIFLPWCWSVTEEPCSFEYFRAKTSANPQQSDFSYKTRGIYIFVLKLTIKL